MVQGQTTSMALDGELEYVETVEEFWGGDVLSYLFPLGQRLGEPLAPRLGQQEGQKAGDDRARAEDEERQGGPGVRQQQDDRRQDATYTGRHGAYAQPYGPGEEAGREKEEVRQNQGRKRRRVGKIRRVREGRR